ncbi:hydrogen gas-evolving membrane-bound hydrogenase subunit E [Ningiella sp. W23]|uniref:hydrogen gas-evolving membrane-bound hydrogenase subunit E n=1 Tax=Ningiella sp. W23 TaxID=3023715 RepID=UPI003757E8E4
MTETIAPASQKLLKAIIVISVLCLVIALLYAMSAPLPDQRLVHTLVQDNLSQSGVTNPVTAVLLNFRAYDTLIEFAVFYCVTIAVMPFLSESMISNVNNDKDLVLLQTCRIFIPPTILVAGYLLWIGASAPGGAFQAAALLAGTLVLLSLANIQHLDVEKNGSKFVIVGGLLAFCTVFISTIIIGNAPLQYPVKLAGLIVILVEFFATFAVALSLFVCFETIHKGHV